MLNKIFQKISLKFGGLISLIIKEFHTIWRDKKSRSVIFLPTIMQLFIFSHAATLDITNIKLGVLDYDKTEITREFIRQIKSSRYFSKIYNFKNQKELKNAIDEEKIRVGIFIENDFTKNYKTGNNPSVMVLSDGRRTNSSQIISSYISEIANNFSPLGQVKKSSTSPFFEVRNHYNPNLSYHLFIVASLMGILPMTAVVLLSSLSLAREKEMGTFDELLVLPFKTSEIIFGKVIVPLFFGLVNGVIILFLSRIFFKLPFEGSFLLFMGALSLFLTSVAGIGLFISSIFKTQQQAMLGVFVFMFPAIILSGYTSPIENITPEFLQHLTVLNPLRFFLVISKGIILKNMNFYYVSLNLLPIVIIAIITLTGAGWAFRAKLE